jgi:hypothetical protein
MTYHKYSTEEVQNVMSQHMSAMKELGAPKERVDSYLESMSKQRATREVAHKVFERDAFIKPHNVSERDWKKGTTFQGTMDTFKAYGDSLLANDPLKEVYRSTVEKMGAFLDKHGESIQKAPVSEVRILKKNVYNLTMAMGETEEDRTTRLAMSMLYSGAATQETIANFNFLGKESMSIAQSQFLDLPMAKLLKGKFANVKAVQNENGVNLVDQNSGKSLYSVRDQINSAGQFETVGRISKSEIIKTHPKGRKGLQEDHLSDIRPLVVEVLHEVFEKILVA